jgi:hypothetical protein
MLHDGSDLDSFIFSPSSSVNLQIDENEIIVEGNDFENNNLLNSDVVVKAGLVMVKKHRLEDAFQYFKHAFLLDPNNEKICRYLQWTSIKKYIENLLSGYQLKVKFFLNIDVKNYFAFRFVDLLTGRGVFAKKIFMEGEPILLERPILCVPTKETEESCLCCHHCLRFVGNLDQQYQKSTRNFVIKRFKKHNNNSNVNDILLKIPKFEPRFPAYVPEEYVPIGLICKFFNELLI